MNIRCPHRHVFEVSSHEDPSAAVAQGQPTAVTYCCASPACLTTARGWVKALAGTEAVVTPFTPPPPEL